MGIESQKPVDIKRIGSTLVAAFHRASPPLIWRFDLERNHSFSLALQGDEGEWELGLTSQKGEFQPVACFKVREDAERAFVKVERLLAQKNTGWFKTVFRGIGAVILLIILAGLLIGGGMIWKNFAQIRQVSDAVSNAEAGAQVQKALKPKPGNPVPADEFFSQ